MELLWIFKTSKRLRHIDMMTVTYWVKVSNFLLKLKLF